jgi:hypothetical protein
MIIDIDIFIPYTISMDTYKQSFLLKKKERREKKRSTKRGITGEEVIYIFEKVLEGWKTIKIYNTMIQQDPNSGVDKKKVEVIATGNSKVFDSELPIERYQHYLELREKVYEKGRQSLSQKIEILSIK